MVGLHVPSILKLGVALRFTLANELEWKGPVHKSFGQHGSAERALSSSP